ncbi:MAG: AraC family transcriptional regulator [Acutalibacteraceae bacterium]|nr:AraC family transcriptional regulator [Acutalibacteraceae bacterium]
MFFGENEISLELLGVFKIKREAFNHKSFTSRSYDSLSIRLSGSGKFDTKNKTISAKKGDILYIPKNADYIQSTLSEDIIVIHFINYSFTKSDEIECISVEDSPFLEETFRQMYDVWKEKKQGHRYLCMSLLYNILYFLNCQKTESIIDSITHDGKMNTVMDYIHTNYRSGEISISQLADMCAVSETYFRKLFKKIHGVSPQQYIINLKLEFASHLLGSNLYTVSEVSRKSGFNDSKYFSRLFKNHFGTTPKKYQDLFQLNSPPIRYNKKALQ